VKSLTQGCPDIRTERKGEQSLPVSPRRRKEKTRGGGGTKRKRKQIGEGWKQRPKRETWRTEEGWEFFEIVPEKNPRVGKKNTKKDGVWAPVLNETSEKSFHNKKE